MVPEVIECQVAHATALRTEFFIVDDLHLAASLQRGLASFPHQALAASAINDTFPQRALLLVSMQEATRLLMGQPCIAPSTKLMVYRADCEPLLAALHSSTKIIAVIDANCAPDAFTLTLRTALTSIGQQAETTASSNLAAVLDIGRALYAEKDLDTLLGLILTRGRELIHADGASIYTYENEQLCFRLWQNATTGRSGSRNTAVSLESIAGHVAHTGRMVVISDVYKLSRSAPYAFDPVWDQATGYCTRSLLTVPLKNKEDEVVGVLQFINCKRDSVGLLRSMQDVNRYVIPFDAKMQMMALALAGQAGIALENNRLYADITGLFDSFVHASVSAIESRDPSTAGHSVRVADLSERLAIAVDGCELQEFRRIHFSSGQIRELRYASLLHDFGKVGVREHVLVKAKKLYPHELDKVTQRFKYAKLALEQQTYRQLVEQYALQGTDPAHFKLRWQEAKTLLEMEQRKLEEFYQLVLHANEPSVSYQEIDTQLAAVAGFRFMGEGEEIALLDPYECASLSLARGSLRPEERAEIESHVSHTYSFLKMIPWTKDLAKLPDIAHAHHEKLDGSGYPRQLRGEEIPMQSRIMAIADIYDALTAADRPYKQAVPTERALDILGSEAKQGKIDLQLYHLFVAAKIYQQ